MQLDALVDRLFENHDERRRQPRTQIEMSVKILVVERTEESTEPVLLDGIVHDVSVTGAMLSTKDRLLQERIWLKFVNRSKPIYVEADVVRTSRPQIPLAHTYGIRFTSMLDQHDMTVWSDNRRPSRSDSFALRASPTPLEISVGDLIDVG